MKRNTELILKVAAAIENDPDRYNQLYYFSPAKNTCGTACCVAGHVLAQKHKVNLARVTPVDACELAGLESLMDVAGELLGLDCDEYEWLFSANRNEDAMLKILYSAANGGSLEDWQQIEEEFGGPTKFLLDESF